MLAPQPARRYYATPDAYDDLWHCPQVVHDSLWAYYHFKRTIRTGTLPVALHRSQDGVDQLTVSADFLGTVAMRQIDEIDLP